MVLKSWYILILTVVVTVITNSQQCTLYVICCQIMTAHTVGLRGSAVERQSLSSVLSPSCARPVADA